MKVPQHKEIFVFSKLEVGDTYRYREEGKTHYAMKINQVGEAGPRGIDPLRNAVRLSDGVLLVHKANDEVEKVEGMFVFKRKKGDK